MGTLGVFPNPPATGSHEQSSCSPTRARGEPWEGSQTLPRRAPPRDLDGNPGRVPKPSRDGLARAKLVLPHAIGLTFVRAQARGGQALAGRGCDRVWAG